jgi:hypothetical protein
VAQVVGVLAPAYVMGIGTPFNPLDVLVLVVAAILGIATASTLAAAGHIDHECVTPPAEFDSAGGYFVLGQPRVGIVISG